MSHPPPVLHSTAKPEPAAGPAALPRCPDHLQDEARAEWERVVAELAAADQVHRLDRAVLASYCEAWQRWVAAQGQLRPLGPIVKSPSGFPIQNPYLTVANKAMEQVTRLAGELGLSPRSRVRIGARRGGKHAKAAIVSAPPAEATPLAMPAAGELTSGQVGRAARAQRSRMVGRVLDWILEGKSEPEILAAIATELPGAAAPALVAAAYKSLAESGEADPTIVKGFAIEATRGIYQKALEAEDLPTALRAVKQLTEIAGRGPT